MELVAYGAQDIYLTGNPEITFFLFHYKRHTNFAIETKKINVVANFGGCSEIIIPRQGDLVSNMFVHIKLPGLGLLNPPTTTDAEVRTAAQTANGITDPTQEQLETEVQKRINCFCENYGWVDAIGHAIIDCAEISIGGQLIDRQYGEWMEIYTQLSQTLEKDLCFQDLIGRKFDIKSQIDCTVNNGGVNLYVPLNFWFNRNIGQALPLIALQYHEVTISINWKKFADVWTDTIKNQSECPYEFEVRCQNEICASLITDYIYLDTDERKKFASSSHEYLIDQVQKIPKTVPVSANSVKTEIPFNHPVKELVWTIQYSHSKEWCYDNNSVTKHSIGACGECAVEEVNTTKNCYRNNCFNYGLPSFVNVLDNNADAIVNAKLQFNGIDRMMEFDGKYYNSVQPYQRHTACPSKGIYVYSFALKPEEPQPTGTANFSRIDNAHISIQLYPISKIGDKVRDQNGNCVNITGTVNLDIWATNVNVLRIMSGMGGLAYSN